MTQIGRDLARAVDGDLPEYSDDLHQHGEEMDASEAAGFEPPLEAIDMSRPKRLDARDRLASIREIGEELRNGDGESLYGRTGAERTPWRRQVAKRSSHGQGEAQRSQRSEVDRRLTAVLNGNREAQAGDGIGIRRDRDAIVAAESDLTPLAWMAAHDPGFGTSASSSSTAASTVSAR